MRHALISALACTGLMACSQFAAAADLPASLPVKAPAAAVASSWTGWYAGINGGYHVGRYSNRAFTPDPTVDAPNTSGISSPNGGVFGVQAGYNWQVAPRWLVGVEGDWQWLTGRDTVCLGECGNFPGQGDEVVQVTTKLKWLATARGRVGYIHNDYLWYITGGGAFGKVEQSVQAFELDNSSAVVGAFGTNTVKTGWTLGGGVETQLWQGWSAKLEYLYVDLGTVSSSAVVTYPGAPLTVQQSVDTKVRDHIIRAGLNWHF